MSRTYCIHAGECESATACTSRITHHGRELSECYMDKGIIEELDETRQMRLFGEEAPNA